MKDTSCLGSVAQMGLLRRMLCLLLLGSFLAAIGGCTRAFFRNSADNEVNDILKEKDKIPLCPIEDFHVYPDERARYADPTNKDWPTQPPDDRVTYQLSPHPQGPYHAGVANVYGTAYLEMIKAWDTANREERDKEKKASKEAEEKAKSKQSDQGTGAAADAASRSGPVQTLFDEPLTFERQGFLLSLDQSVELGAINSRIYQTFREDLYLGALPVTLQRFSFAYQWSATEDAIREYAGPLAPGGPANNWNLGTGVGFTKLFSTGALLTTVFANNTVFNFTGAHPFTSTSTIDLSAVQPLLAGGGQAVTLEPLTQVERTLVYEIRAYARFRKQFYMEVILGTIIPSDLPTAASVISANSPISTLAAVNLASTDVAGGFVGVLPTLYRELDMAADKKLVQDLERALKLYEGYQEGGLFSPLQVAQVNSTLLQARNAVLTDNQFVINALDQLKLVLGLPTNLPLILDDAPGRPVTRQLDRYYELLADADATTKKLEQREKVAPAKLRDFLFEMFTTAPLVRMTPFREKLPPSWEAWKKANKEELESRLKTLEKERDKLLDLKADFDLKKQPFPEKNASRLRTITFESDLGNLEQILREYESQPWEKVADKAQRLLNQSKLYRLVSYAAQTVLVWARNDRFERVGKLWDPVARAPLGDLELLTTDVDKAQQAAVAYAMENRVDLMNARAQVVDAWRQLRVTANALMGVFNVGYNLTSVTPTNGVQPFAFSPSTTLQQLTLNAQLPLVRKAERNNYRTAIINYQRARRNLMNLEDNIAADVRFDVRQLHLFAANYTIQQKVLELFYSQVENALEVIVAPVDPDALKASGTTSAGTAAALTNQYLTALSSLNGAQTKMYDIWLSYIATRAQLYLDLERMPLDSRGVWIDESANSANTTNASNPAGGARLGQPLPNSERGPAVEQLPQPAQLFPPEAKEEE